MKAHTAKSLFDLNMESTDHCLALYDGIQQIGTTLDASWLLRGMVVFSVSAMDAYFHDKIRYRAAKYGSLEDLPHAMAGFSVSVGDLGRWQKAARKGNVLRNWIVEHYSRRPLQTQDEIAEALKVVGILDLWPTIEPDNKARGELLDQLSAYVARRNEIAHEGDRLHSRSSGKELRAIDRKFACSCVDFVRNLVDRVEKAFPK